MNECKIKIFDEDQPSFEYRGSLDKENGAYKLRYSHVEDGAKSDYELCVKADELEILRFGNSSMKMRISSKEKTPLEIAISEGKFVGEIETNAYEFTENGGVIKVVAEYDMIMEGERICRKITLEAKPI